MEIKSQTHINYETKSNKVNKKSLARERGQFKLFVFSSRLLQYSHLILSHNLSASPCLYLAFFITLSDKFKQKHSKHQQISIATKNMKNVN